MQNSARQTSQPVASTDTHRTPACSFLTDISTIRSRARKQLADGAVTPSYSANRLQVLRLLDEALATEIVCVMRYRRHYFMVRGAAGEAIKGELMKHAREEQAHADLIAARIVQLGGKPDMNPLGVRERSHTEYVEGGSLSEMVQEDLIAERVAIESYAQIIRFLGNDDPTTRGMLERILADEEKHAEELVSLLSRIGGEEGAGPVYRHGSFG